MTDERCDRHGLVLVIEGERRACPMCDRHEATVTVAQTLRRLYPQNPDVVLGLSLEARVIVEALDSVGLTLVRRPSDSDESRPPGNAAATPTPHFANVVPCPVCKAEAGVPCVGSGGWAHVGRVVDADEAVPGNAARPDLPSGPDPLDCSLCEGVGYVASNFGIASQGRPELVRCPSCNPPDVWDNAASPTGD